MKPKNRHREGAMLQLIYARITGVVFVLIGAADLLLDIPVIDLPQDVLYLSTGSILLYVGFWEKATCITRPVIRGMGILYLLAGVLVLGSIFLLDLPNLIGDSLVFDGGHIVFGIVSILVGCLSPRVKASSESATSNQRKSEPPDRVL
jgi:hypothetical protein